MLTIPRNAHNGQQKREKAQHLVVKAPDVVAKIMLDDNANARHRIDAAASLDKLAANPAENSAAAAGFFQITINLGANSDGMPVIEHYEKSLVIDPNGGDLDDGRAVPQSSLPIVNKRWDDDSNDILTAPARTGYIDHLTHSPTVDRFPVDPQPAKPVKPIKQKRAPAAASKRVHEPGVHETISSVEELSAAQQAGTGVAHGNGRVTWSVCLNGWTREDR